jgi:hypothetical protein
MPRAHSRVPVLHAIDALACSTRLIASWPHGLIGESCLIVSAKTQPQQAATSRNKQHLRISKIPRADNHWWPSGTVWPEVRFPTSRHSLCWKAVESASSADGDEFHVEDKVRIRGNKPIACIKAQHPITSTHTV